jgi:hypothetical protein
MNHSQRHLAALCIAFSCLSALGCASGESVSEPRAPLAPIAIGSDLTAVDVCRAIPGEEIEAVTGRELVAEPERFEYYDTPGTRGCSYDAGKDGSGNAYFGYVALTPIDAYENQPLYKNVDVDGIGQSAYFNNGADARQLWVKVDDRVALVVAFGDEPKEEAAKALARRIVAAIE